MEPVHFQRAVTPNCFHLDDEAVHVWWAALDPPLLSLPGRLSLLSADEKARAQRFYFERDRLRYIAGRACLRRLLGGYLALRPAQIEFEYSQLGKPALKKTFSGKVLQFNLSNSDNRVLYVFNWQRQVGIDLELVHPMPDEDNFALQFFCEPESMLLHSLSGDAKRKTFFELWTCKEALLKAMGDGLTRPINEVEVALQNGARGWSRSPATASQLLVGRSNSSSQRPVTRLLWQLQARAGRPLFTMPRVISARSRPWAEL